jgi:crotonobetainyl-CoA:carnitine CoA-transferase CaiB-like acyl-CoA transferase
MTHALDGIRVLDLSRQLPGPFCSALLAGLGADVLTIAAPADPLGTGIPLLGGNKRSMALDLKRPGGRDVFLRLAAQADVLLEGFRPGVTARLGIDHDTLRTHNPRLVYCAISGYGQDGPYRDRVGHDVNYLGQAGVLDFIGVADGPPVLAGVQLADLGGGALMAAVGILGALIARAQTGRGQFVDIAMLDGALVFNAYPHLLWTLTGELPPRARVSLTGYYACYATYETRDGRYVTVGAYEPHFWATLCRHFGREDLVSEQWTDGPRREETLAFFRAKFKEKTMVEWERELADEEICFGPVNTVAEALADPQLRHRGMAVERDTPGGRRTLLGCPITLGDTPAVPPAPAPRFGEHTEDVLREIGYDADGIARLRADGTI